MPVTVQDLLADKPEPVCVSETAMAVEALRLMIAGDYSQLPVIAESEELVGMITSDSIVRALSLLNVKIDGLKVSNATQTTKLYKLDSDLSELLDGLRDTYAVPVVDNYRRVIGIVTNYDTAAYFRSRAEDMMLVEDVETMLKDCIRVDLWASQGKIDDSELMITVSEEMGAKTFDMLTFNDYLLLFIHGTRWQKFSRHVDLERDACRKMLDQVKDVRNDLFHFRTDIAAERRYALNYCRDWLNRYAQAIMAALGPVEVEEDQPVTIESLANEKGTSTEAITSQIDALAENPQVIEKLSSATSKYEGIATFLQTLPQHVDNVEITFTEFESIIESELPRTAYEHRSWWANDSVGHVQSRQWLDAGWRVSNVNISQQRATFTRIKEREQKYIEFYSELLTEVRAKGLELKDVSPSGRSFITFDGIRSMTGDFIGFVGCSFARGGRFRVEFYIDAKEHSKNQLIFDSLLAHKDEIESDINSKLEWETLDQKRASRVAAYHVGWITDTPERLETLCRWAAEAVVEFYHVFLECMKGRIVEAEAKASAR